MSEYLGVLRYVNPSYTEMTLANSADPDLMLQNAESDQGLHYMLSIQEFLCLSHRWTVKAHVNVCICSLLRAFSDHHKIESVHDTTNKMTCAPSEGSDQPGHLPSLIRVFAVHMKKTWVLSYPLSAQLRFWSDWADAQADLSLRWEHRSVYWFCHAAAHMELETFWQGATSVALLSGCMCGWRILNRMMLRTLSHNTVQMDPSKSQG